MAESRTEKSLKPKSKSKKSKSKKHGKVRMIHIQPAENGGFVSTHDYHDEEPDENGASNTPPSSIHALGNLDQLHQHLDDTLGQGGGGSAQPQAQAAPAAEGPGGM